MLLLPILSGWNHCQYKLNAACVLSRWGCKGLPRGHGNKAGQEGSDQPCKSMGKCSDTLTLPMDRTTPPADGRASVHKTQQPVIQCLEQEKSRVALVI